MSDFSLRLLHVAGLVLLLAVGFPRGNNAAQDATIPEDFPPAKLRGYGTISATFRKQADGSVLSIQCEDEGKAKLLQAKYLSDLCVLPGVRLFKGKDYTCCLADGQGVIAAWQQDSQVTILASPSAEKLELLRAQVKPSGVSSAQVDVPMYLDRWDKFGFRFYYSPWRTPDGVAVADYNFPGDFDYAQSQDNSGLVLWDHLNPINTAEGMLRQSYWDWAAAAAAARRLPVAINISMGTGGTALWQSNRYPWQVQQKMPQFSGNYHKVADPYLGGMGVLSWMGRETYDLSLGVLQESVRHWKTQPNVVSFLEPNGELHHGHQDIFLEYGPLADASYRKFLEEKYRTPDALSERWFGRPDAITSWDQVRVPELASFLGWNDAAIDLRDEWAVNYEALADGKKFENRHANDEFFFDRVPSEPAPQEWYAANFDDSSWPRVIAPGHDVLMLMPHRPAVFRRTVSLDAKKLAAHPRWWLYVWDLNLATDDRLSVHVNGRPAGVSEPLGRGLPHWGAFEVTDFLKSGKNQFSLRVPKGYLSYRVYLSPDEPRQFPQLGEHRNAQWVDLIDWTRSTRVDLVRRGMSMIRQEDPDRPITLMSPSRYVDAIKSLALDYGGEFRDTGFIAGNYCDYLPGIMQGVDLPFSVEPGGPAGTLEEFRRMMGLYLISNVQGVDYFIHLGSLMWHDEIRRNFEEHKGLYHLFGKFHSPKAEVAVLFNNRAQNLTGFPWGNDIGANQTSGYFEWNIGGVLRGRFPYDFLTESAFDDGSAAGYKVIVDSNSSIMEEGLVSEIGKWVRAGGIFITSGQTGRHTPTKFHAWPVAKLTGYEVARVDRYSPEGRAEEKHTLSSAPRQAVFSGAWNEMAANGLGLRKISPEAEDLLLWDDGTVAAGMRRLGKGLVIHTGVNFGDARLPDRIELSPDSEQMKRLGDFYAELLTAQKIAPVAVSAPAPMVFTRRYVSNNGLYDFWVIWNENHVPVTTDMVFGDGFHPAEAREMSTGQMVKTVSENGKTLLRGIELPPQQARGYLTPRNEIADASRRWLELQRRWWRGTAPPAGAKLPTPAEVQQCAKDLTQDWAFKPLADGEDADALAGAGVDDSSWPRRNLNIWSMEHPDVRRAVYRKKFRVPESWRGGTVALWMQNFDWATFHDRGNVWLDGRQITKDCRDGLRNERFPELRPGAEHVLAVEVEGKGSLRGVAGECWLAWRPEPVATQDLGGGWTVTKDALRYEATAEFPGSWHGRLARRSFDLDKKFEGKTVMLHYEGNAETCGLIINGRWVRGMHHPMDQDWQINITPWVKFGGENEIQIGRMNERGEGNVRAVGLDFYDAGTPVP